MLSTCKDCSMVVDNGDGTSRCAVTADYSMGAVPIHIALKLHALGLWDDISNPVDIPLDELDDDDYGVSPGCAQYYNADEHYP